MVRIRRKISRIKIWWQENKLPAMTRWLHFRLSTNPQSDEILCTVIESKLGSRDVELNSLKWWINGCNIQSLIIMSCINFYINVLKPLNKQHMPVGLVQRSQTSIQDNYLGSLLLSTKVSKDTKYFKIHFESWAKYFTWRSWYNICDTVRQCGIWFFQHYTYLRGNKKENSMFRC